MVFILFYLIFAAIYGAVKLLTDLTGYAVGYVIRFFRHNGHPVKKLIQYTAAAALIILMCYLLSKT